MYLVTRVIASFSPSTSLAVDLKNKLFNIYIKNLFKNKIFIPLDKKLSVKWVRKPTRCNNQMFIINTFSTCFGHHYAHLRENKTCVTARGVLRWYCWMWLVAVVGHCVVGCEHCEGLASYNAAPHNRYQPHPAEPAQHTARSNTRSLSSWRWA